MHWVLLLFSLNWYIFSQYKNVDGKCNSQWPSIAPARYFFSSCWLHWTCSCLMTNCTLQFVALTGGSILPWIMQWLNGIAVNQRCSGQEMNVEEALPFFVAFFRFFPPLLMHATFVSVTRNTETMSCEKTPPSLTIPREISLASSRHPPARMYFF